jgi:hypothetical protein
MFIPVTMRAGDVTVYERELEGIAARAEDLRVPFTQIGKDLKAGIGKQFATEGAWAYDWPYGGGPWKPLSDSYRRWKEQHYPGRPILVASGMMRDRSVMAGPMVVTSKRLFYTPRDATQTRSFTYRRASGAEWERTPRDDRKLAWGYLVRSPHSRSYNMAEVAYFHQTGAGSLPRRPMVAFTLGELREWDRVLLAWLNAREPFGVRP